MKELDQGTMAGVGGQGEEPSNRGGWAGRHTDGGVRDCDHGASRLEDQQLASGAPPGYGGGEGEVNTPYRPARHVQPARFITVGLISTS